MARPKFESISHLGELLIVIFYAEAYQEAFTKDIECFQKSGLVLRPILLFVIFLTVTVRFFVGNYLHLADERWNEKVSGSERWTVLWTRRLYYIDASFIALESLSMILLGSVGSDAHNVSQLVIPLILISSVDVLWTGFQWLSKKKFRPVDVTSRWMWLNIGVILLLGYLLCLFRGQPLSVATLGWITGINVAAFVVDMIFVNQYGA